MYVVQYTRMTVHAAVFCLICLLNGGASSSSSSSPSHVSPPPRGCGVDVEPPYRVLCDLETAWGVVLEAVACAGVLTSLILSVVLLVRLRCIGDRDRRSGLGPLLLLLATLTGLFSLSLAYLVGKNQVLCVVRRALWGPLFALCFSCLLVQGLRLRKLVAGKSSPAGGALAGLGAALALVQGIISGEWVLLTVVREGHPACDYPPVDFALTCAYSLGLLLVAMGLSLGVVLCGGEIEPSEREEADRNNREDEKKRWRCNGVWLFLCSLASALLWVAWLGFYLYGNPALRARGRAERPVSGGRKGSKVWDEPALAVALVTQGWILLILHAIPEAHLCLRKPAAAAALDYFESAQPHPPPPPRFGEERPARPQRPFADNQAFSMEEQSATLRGTYRSNQGSIRPGVPFRGHVYQPTEMALVMNGGATDSAEEVIFVCEKPARRVNEIIINQDKRLALQRDIDQESQPRGPARPLVVQRMVTLDMVAGDMKEVAKQTEKKRKRPKDEDMGGAEEQGHSVDKERSKAAKIKKRGETKEEGSLNGEKKTKKKKKKKQLEENGGDSVSQCSLSQKESSGRKQKKLKTTKNKTMKDKSVQSKAPGWSKTEEEEGKKKSKKVTVDHQVKVINIDDDPDDDDDDVVVVTTTTTKKKARTKTSKTVAGVEEESKGLGQKTKMKKKEVLVGTGKGDAPQTAQKIKTTTKKKKTEKPKPTKSRKASSGAVAVEEQGTPKLKKKLKELKSNLSSMGEVEQEVSIPHVKELKRKKRKTAVDDDQAAIKDVEQNTETFVFVASESKGKGKRGTVGASEEITLKAKKEEVEVSVDEKKKKKRKKIKLELDAPTAEATPEVIPHTDVVFLSEKTGNRDEVIINQERRLALQMDIDNGSRTQSPAKPSFGQWSTAQFDSTDKQQKFLRLMGGFKKDTQLTRGPGAMRPNMALARDQQQNLQQALQGEFERAQSRRADFSGRGAGLGFSAPPSQTFRIDANASRSVRFDD